MPFRRNRKSASTGPNPGLTPIDDIHEGGSMLSEFEPDRTTGLLPAQDDETSAATAKRRRPAKTKNSKR
jgi:hypothetical protein